MNVTFLASIIYSKMDGCVVLIQEQPIKNDIQLGRIFLCVTSIDCDFENFVRNGRAWCFPAWYNTFSTKIIFDFLGGDYNFCRPRHCLDLYIYINCGEPFIFNGIKFYTSTIVIFDPDCCLVTVFFNFQNRVPITDKVLGLYSLICNLIFQFTDRQISRNECANGSSPTASGTDPFTEASRTIPVINIAKPIPTKHKDALNGEHQNNSTQNTKCHHDGMVFKSLHYTPPRALFWSVLHHTFRLKSMGLAA